MKEVIVSTTSPPEAEQIAEEAYIFAFPMLAKVHTAAVVGLDGEVVEVEFDTSRGLPSFSMVGPITQLHFACQLLLLPMA